jgi:hypothetical protein
VTDAPTYPRGPRFDFTVNLGHVLSVSAILTTMIIGWAQFDARLQAVEKQQAVATSVLLEQVRQDGRLNGIELRLTRLERFYENRP